MRRIGIIGGGPGGLMTAYSLQKITSEPITTTIFEASPRLGGKILTKPFEHYGMIYEAGAAEIYDYSPVGEDPLRELIEELGLPIRMMGGSAVIMNHHLLENLDDVREHLGEETERSLMDFHRKARDWISPQEFYNADENYSTPNAHPELRFDSVLQEVSERKTREYISHLIHSDLATEPSKTSITYGLQNYLMNDPAYMRLYSVEGGNEKIIHELVNRISADYRMQHIVKSISRTDKNKYTVLSQQNGENVQDDFDYLVVALPNNYLPEVEFQGSRLSSALKRHHTFYNHPAHYLRFTILFDYPFWRNQMTESWCMLDQFEGCCLYDESSRIPDAEHGVLGWLLGGDVAEKLSELPDDELIQMALDSLPKFIEHGREHFIEGHVHRWVGAVNAIPGGVVPQTADRRHQPEPVEHPHLFMVGDYLFDSTLNGVLDSADYVAHWIANLLIENTGEVK